MRAKRLLRKIVKSNSQVFINLMSQSNEWLVDHSNASILISKQFQFLKSSMSQLMLDQEVYVSQVAALSSTCSKRHLYLIQVRTRHGDQDSSRAEESMASVKSILTSSLTISDKALSRRIRCQVRETVFSNLATSISFALLQRSMTNLLYHRCRGISRMLLWVPMLSELKAESLDQRELLLTRVRHPVSCLVKALVLELPINLLLLHQ